MTHLPGNEDILEHCLQDQKNSTMGEELRQPLQITHPHIIFSFCQIQVRNKEEEGIWDNNSAKDLSCEGLNIIQYIK